MAANSQPVPPDSVFARLAHLWRREGQRIVVFSDANFNLKRYEFNHTGARIWELLDGQRKVRDIVRCLCEEYPEVSAEIVETTVVSFISELQSHWLATSQDQLRQYE